MEFDTFTKQEALAALFAAWQPARTVETVAVDECVGRICAAEQSSVLAYPVVRASCMDGVAVASSAFGGGRPDLAAFRLGEDYVRADTGDDFDDRFDAVIRIEDVTFLEGGGIALPDELEMRPGMNVEPSGGSLAPGDFLMSAGWRIRPEDTASLVRGGITELPVVARPRVAFIPTGSELVPAGTVPGRGQQVDCNSTFARHVLASYGAEPVLYPIVRDKEADLEAALELALAEADIVLVNGGSSKGEEDLNATLVRKRGEVFCHGALAAPGRPTMIGLIDGRPVVVVPGPMVGCCYVFDWCVSRIVAHALGVEPAEHRRVQAVLTDDLNCPQSLEFWNRLDLRRTEGGFEAEPLSLRRGSGLYRIGVTSGQYINRIGEQPLKAGEELTVELLCDPGCL
jgi:molybdopterin molybdotransferase/putative molybdopterin biosynthesis protein